MNKEYEESLQNVLEKYGRDIVKAFLIAMKAVVKKKVKINKLKGLHYSYIRLL